MSRLTKDQQENVRKIFHQTASIRQTANRTGHSRKAIRRVLGCSIKLPNAPQTRPRKSKLDPFKAKNEKSEKRRQNYTIDSNYQD